MRLLCFYAFLALGLLTDGAYLFRLTLLCSVLHEAAHAGVYLVCARRLPHLRFSAGGVCLSRTEGLSEKARLAVLAAGPVCNLLLAALLLLAARQKASYDVYFLAAVSACVGCYNLLPVGMLDGAQILEVLLPAACQPGLLRLQRAFVVLLFVCSLVWAVFGTAPIGARVLALAGPGYLLVENAFS